MRDYKALDDIIHILLESNKECIEIGCFGCEFKIYKEICKYAKMASYLLDNGVKFQYV